MPDIGEDDWQLYALWPYFFGKEAWAILTGGGGWSGSTGELKALMLMPGVAALGAFWWFDANGLMFWRDKSTSNLLFAYGAGAVTAFGATRLRPELVKRALTGKW